MKSKCKLCHKVKKITSYVCAPCISRLEGIFAAEQGTEDFMIAEVLRAGGKEARKRILQAMGKPLAQPKQEPKATEQILMRELANTRRKLRHKEERIKHLECQKEKAKKPTVCSRKGAIVAKTLNLINKNKTVRGLRKKTTELKD